MASSLFTLLSHACNSTDRRMQHTEMFPALLLTRHARTPVRLCCRSVRMMSDLPCCCCPRWKWRPRSGHQRAKGVYILLLPHTLLARITFVHTSLLYKDTKRAKREHPPPPSLLYMNAPTREHGIHCSMHRSFLHSSPDWCPTLQRINNQCLSVCSSLHLSSLVSCYGA